MRIKELKVGDVVEAMFKINPASDLFDSTWIPVRVMEEYKYFWVCDVLPHRNPNLSWGLSRPYTMSIGKHVLSVGDVSCRPLKRVQRKVG